jgi:hypothetical protein
MIDFHTEDGEYFSGTEVRRVKLILGKSTQCAFRGVVELEGGEVRIVTVRHSGQENLNGHTRLVSAPMAESFGVVVARLVQMERDFITDITD